MNVKKWLLLVLFCTAIYVAGMCRGHFPNTQWISPVVGFFVGGFCSILTNEGR